MNILSWNCQGLGTPLTVRELRALMAQFRPSLVFLMETKNKSEFVQRVKRRLQFQSCLVVDPVGTAGGLAIMWDDRITIEVDSMAENFINLKCEEGVRGNKMRITFVHAPHTYPKRLQLWEKLKLISAENTLHWVCLRDFNEVRFYWEKVGKRMAENYRMSSFRDCLDACSLMDIDSKGCAFTWANNREGEDYVKERLDRVVCTLEWRLMYPEAEAFALPAIGSDHSPIILSCQSTQARRKKNFRFEAFWLENDECREVVLNSWAPPIQNQQGLVGKIKLFKRHSLNGAKRSLQMERRKSAS